MEAKQPTEEPTPTKEGAPKDGALRPRPSTSTLLVMLVVFVVGALLVFSSQQQKYSEIDYTFFHQQLEAGNIAEIQMSGQTVRGRFKVPPIDPKAVAAAAKKLQEDAKKKFDEAKAKKDKSADDKASDSGKAKQDESKSAASTNAKKAEPSEGKNAKKDASKVIKRLHPEFSVYLPPLVGEDLEKLLLEKGVTIHAEPPTDNANMLMLVWLLVTVLLFAGVWTMMRRTRDQFMGGGIFSGFAKSPAKRYDTSKSRVTFKDVAGLEGVKLDLQEIVEFLKNPEKFQRLGGRIPKGVLLMGPPGTGKTLLARAVAGEAGVPFFSISGSEFIQMFVGVGASRVRDLFKTAKENAPAILFIDEIDAVGRQRGAGLGGGHDEREQTLNQILSEMDGFSQTESVIVLAATNRPDVLDPALLRPGRFDRHVTVDRPNQKGRLQLFEVHTHDVPLADDVNIERLAAGTIGLTGADIRNLVNEAALWATRNGKEKVDMSDFEYARDKILMGPKREEVLVGKEKTMTAYHESGHALLAWILPGADLVHKVTIIPRGRALGVTHLLPQEDRMNIGERDLHARLVFMLGGRAAEKLVFDEYSAGAENDLKEATRLARKMVAHWGMSERLGPVAYRTSEDHPFLGREIVQEHREFSEHTAQVIDEEVARMLHGAADRAQQLLSEHRANLDALSKALEDREALDQSDIEKILGPCANVLPSLNGTPMSAEENGQPSRTGATETTTATPSKSKSD